MSSCRARAVSIPSGTTGAATVTPSLVHSTSPPPSPVQDPASCVMIALPATLLRRVLLLGAAPEQQPRSLRRQLPVLSNERAPSMRAQSKTVVMILRLNASKSRRGSKHDAYSTLSCHYQHFVFISFEIPPFLSSKASAAGLFACSVLLRSRRMIICL